MVAKILRSFWQITIYQNVLIQGTPELSLDECCNPARIALGDMFFMPSNGYATGNKSHIQTHDLLATATQTHTLTYD